MPKMNGSTPFIRKLPVLSARLMPERMRLRLLGTAWVRDLEGIGGKIEGLANSSEGEFLSIGEKLQDFYTRTREISESSSTVADLMSGRELGAVIDDFGIVVDLLKQLEGASSKSSETLRQVLGRLDRVQSNLEKFKKLSMVLNVLCVSTRIESARLGERESGFITLADDVSKLASDIESKCTYLLNRSESLIHLVQQTLSKVLELVGRQIGQLEVVLNNTLSNLMSLTQRQETSFSGAEQIASRYEAISQNIGEIVASMQFQDITRQRLEHTKQALDAVMQNPAEIAPAVDVCRLQGAQLCSARDEFLTAVDTIIENLQHVAGHITSAVEETQELAGAADQTGASFLSEIETGFSTIGSAFAEYADSNSAIRSAIAPVGETLSEMAVYAHDIDGIGTRIRLIALNAIVKACHLGDEGAALSVIADGIHQLSAETCRQTAVVNEDLKSMSLTAQTLSEAMDMEAGCSNIELGRLSETLDDLKSKLRSINDTILSSLKRMDDEGHRLSEDIHEAAGRITALGRVGELITDLVCGLEETTAHLTSLFPRLSTSERADHLRALTETYTMQGEREIHRSIEAGLPLALAVQSMETESATLEVPALSERAVSAADESAGAAEEKSDDDLGDNVELF